MSMAIHPDFKNRLAELETLYMDLRQRLNTLPEMDGDLEGYLAQVLMEIEPVRLPLMETLGSMLADFTAKEKAYHEAYCRSSQLTAILQEAPYYWQIIEKPNGYAGDAEMMEIIYRDRFEGNTTFGKLVHKQATSCPACQAVRNRRHFLKQKIIATGGGNILSLAAGPAREIRDILGDGRSNRAGKSHFHFLALDHDIKTIRTITNQYKHENLCYAVANAFAIIKGESRVAVPRRAAMALCNPLRDFQGINRVFVPWKYRIVHMEKATFSLVYSAGLYDYIKTFTDEPEKGTIGLTKRLFELVRPGGSLIIGNFSPKNPPDIRFIMDCICNWKLIYRNEEEILQFASTIPEREIASMTIEQEPLGINYFLEIKRK